ncbi:hypothetical protein F2Q68_00025080 [Brassica cretica]|uniref:Uncharacterized protein n=2 Tax=Brassica cretica TaxID=69181 RepID=A0A8S9IH94_BRACR|nr:hypothetical protein F2Q68_00025080 [Brassica cretica]KAF3576013.1 hypothetical protein DY000_02030521 [Brassica cretica]
MTKTKKNRRFRPNRQNHGSQASCSSRSRARSRVPNNCLANPTSIFTESAALLTSELRGLTVGKTSVGVQIEGIFQSESVFLQSTLQKPQERTLWTAVVAINKTNGSLGMRDGLMKVVAHVNIQGKSGILKNSLLVTCPILNDLKAIVSKPCQVI